MRLPCAGRVNGEPVDRHVCFNMKDHKPHTAYPKAFTNAEQTTVNGKPAVAIECTCTTHPERMSRATLVGRSFPFPADRIHGFVVMANHPARTMRNKLKSDGIFPETDETQIPREEKS